MNDEARCEALRRTIRARLEPCDESELDALDRMLTAIEERRHILATVKFTPVIEDWPPRSRGEEITATLRDLRDSATYTPRRPFSVIRGGLTDQDREQLRVAGVHIQEDE